MRLSVEAISTDQIVDFSLDENENRAADSSLIIDPLRARSLAANPEARPEDPALLLARAEGQCVGYIAVQWDRLHFRGADHRWAWGHQFFVVPEYRHLPCAMLLLQRSMSLAAGWGAWGIAPEAAKICRALGCWEPVSIERVRSSSWVDALSRVRRVVPFHGIFGVALRFSSRSLATWSERKLEGAGISLEEDDGNDDFVERALAAIDEDAVHFVRSAARLRWYVDFPWIKELRGAPAPDARPHAFTTFRYRHEIELIRLSSTTPSSVGYVLLCHTQQASTTLSRTSLLDWGWSASDEDGYPVAVAAAMVRQRQARTEYLDVFASGRFRSVTDVVPGLRSSPPHPVFLGFAKKSSDLKDLRDVEPEGWWLGSVEGDQIPVVW
jgi:GNAT superfamily N-acetyltransferase